MIGYKKVRIIENGIDTRRFAVIKLKITGAVIKAERHDKMRANHEKLRTNSAVTVDVLGEVCYGNRKTNWMCHISKKKLVFGGKKEREFASIHDSSFKYKKGMVVTPDSFNQDITEDCGSGIHFFLTKKEALNY